MSGKKLTFLGALALAAAAVGLANAAEVPQLDVKLGLWEIATHPQVNGSLPITDEQLAKLPPDQRAKFEAAMQAAVARGAQPRVFKECMTAEKRSHGFDAGSDQSKSNCQVTLVTNTANEFESHRECTSEDGKQSTSVHFRVVSSDHVAGTVNALISHGGKTMTVNSTMEGKWLGPDCGNVKDIELEKTAP
jgi:Spy/CpxP family protein refolding chaperone